MATTNAQDTTHDVTTATQTSDVTTQSPISTSEVHHNDVTSSSTIITSQTTQVDPGDDNNPLTTKSSGDSSSSEDFFSDLQMEHYAIFGAVGVILISVLIIICCLCTRHFKRKRSKPKAGPFDSPDDIHNYAPKTTASEGKLNGESKSQVNTMRYTKEPTKESFNGRNRGEVNSGVYQDIPNVSTLPKHDTIPEHKEYNSNPHPKYGAANLQANNAFAVQRHRPLHQSGTYGQHIDSGYRGSNHHVSGYGSNHSNERRYAHQNTQPQMHGPSAPAHQYQGSHTNPGQPGHYAHEHTHGTQHTQADDNHGSYHSKSHTNSPTGSSTQRSYLSNAQPTPFLPNTLTSRSQIQTQVGQNQYGSRPRDALREPRSKPVYVKQSEQHRHYQPRHPPATRPKPTVAASSPPTTPAIDMQAMLGSLKPISQSKPATEQNCPPKSGGTASDELSLNPLFNKIKDAISDGCKTIRLYKTESGDFALQPFDEDEQEVYEDAETARAHVGRSSRHISDFRYEGSNEAAPDEDIYHFIHTSMLISQEDGDIVEQGVGGGNVSSAAGVDQGAAACNGHVDPDDQYAETRIYESATATKPRDPQHQLKKQHENAGILKELQARQTSVQEDYENVPSATAPAPPTEDYVNENEVQALHDSRSAGLGDDSGDLYQNHGAINQTFNQSIANTEHVQEDYTNQEVIAALNAKGPLGTHAHVEPQDVYENHSAANPNTAQGYDSREYENREMIEMLADIKRKKEQRELAKQQREPSGEDYENIQLRKSMANDVLGQNVEQLFDTVLRDSLQNDKGHSSKAPVMRMKSKREAKDPNFDNRISRSSLFDEVDAESGPDARTNMGGWAQRDAVTPQMISSHAQVGHVQNRAEKAGGMLGKIGGFFKK